MGEFNISRDDLLSIEMICQKLGISRSTFDRARKSDVPKGSPFIKQALGQNVGVTVFPEPTLFVLGKPRWSVATVNQWLNENADKKATSNLFSRDDD